MGTSGIYRELSVPGDTVTGMAALWTEEIGSCSEASVVEDGSVEIQLDDCGHTSLMGWIEFDALERLYLAAKRLRDERS